MAGERRKSYHGGGFGLRNIDERIKLAFGESYGLRVRSKYGIGTQVSIFLPLDEPRRTAMRSVLLVDDEYFIRVRVRKCVDWQRLALTW